MSQAASMNTEDQPQHTPDSVLDTITNDKELVVTLTNDGAVTLHVRYLGERTESEPIFQVTHDDDAYGTLQTGTVTEDRVRNWIDTREVSIAEVTEITGFHGTIHDTDRLIADLYR
jgi:hypothetical protein